EEYSFRKQIQQLKIGTYKTNNPRIDFGVLPKQINGLIGLYILREGNFIIDLKQMELFEG
ncbi:MAG: hypothetical protein ACO1OC_01185, partial [Tuberibacillus sp.]